MQTKLRLFVGIIGVVFVLAGALLYQRVQQRQTASSELTVSQLRKTVRDHDVSVLTFQRVENNQLQTLGSINVDVVASPEALEQGLSGRTTIPQEGMLFLLPERQIARFWMKDMRFDLDFVWIDGDTIVDITRSVPAPAPSVPLSELPTFSPHSPVTMVLELAAGQADQLGLSLEDTVTVTATTR